jgi:hypothetical protein
MHTGDKLVAKNSPKSLKQGVSNYQNRVVDALKQRGIGLKEKVIESINYCDKCLSLITTTIIKGC